MHGTFKCPFVSIFLFINDSNFYLGARQPTKRPVEVVETTTPVLGSALDQDSLQVGTIPPLSQHDNDECENNISRGANANSEVLNLPKVSDSTVANNSSAPATAPDSVPTHTSARAMTAIPNMDFLRLNSSKIDVSFIKDLQVLSGFDEDACSLLLILDLYFFIVQYSINHLSIIISIFSSISFLPFSQLL